MQFEGDIPFLLGHYGKGCVEIEGMVTSKVLFRIIDSVSQGNGFHHDERERMRQKDLGTPAFTVASAAVNISRLKMLLQRQRFIQVWA